jgi:hypothetical protein
MLDPRIYRTGLIVVVLGVLVLAFSLENQSGALSSSLAPDAFNGQNVYNNMKRMAADEPDRHPGSVGDNDLANTVARAFNQYKFSVSTDTFPARTADGTRTLENVVGVQAGVESGSIVIVAHRDARGSPAIASLAATATLIELARDIAGETVNRTVVLASTSGSQGTAGAIRLAQTIAGPIDAVIVLGDLAGTTAHQPIVVPWSNSQLVAPPALRNTVAQALNQQAAIKAKNSSVLGQLAHLAFPLALSEQAPFDEQGIPAVLLSLSGDRGPVPGAPIAGVDQVNGIGRSVLSTISALDSGPAVPASSVYFIFDRKVVPGWAISVLVLALIVPVLLTTVDGLARARRRGHAVWRWLVLVLLAAVPFALGVGVVIAARAAGVLTAAPPGPVPPGAIPMHSAGIAVLVAAVVVAVGSFLLIRPAAMRYVARGVRPRVRDGDDAGPIEGAVAALLLVMCLVTIAIWISNPFAAALLVPALHIWLLAINPDLRLPFPARLLMLLLSLVPVALVVAYYSVTDGFGPLAAAWSATLLVAGHAVSLIALLEWSIVLGCVLTAGGLLIALARMPRPEQVPVTVRGPVTYAGPGSLGGTESALRR